MRQSSYQFLALVALVGIGCIEPVGPTLTEDEKTEAALVGIWSDGERYSIQFCNNRTFIDSTYLQAPVAGAPRVLWSIARGSYSVSNGILFRSNVRASLVDSIWFGPSGSIVYCGEKILFEGVSLGLAAVDVLAPVHGPNDSLWGSWSLTRWVYHRATDLTEYQGRQRETYTFSRGSDSLSYGWEYLDGSTWDNPTFVTSFVYDSTGLDLFAPGRYDIKVEFSQGKMFWYYSSQTRILDRVR